MGGSAVTELAGQDRPFQDPVPGAPASIAGRRYHDPWLRARWSIPPSSGLDHVAFTEVKLSDTREKALDEFNAAVNRIQEIEECHMIASSFDYLLKVRTPDIRRYRIVLGERISSLPHVASTSTFVAMETVKDR